ncbi:AAA family ATPase [Marinobacterium stanieri]|uniref:AAA family ATPase n=1 Tax=Marinobacterium stanieri TaxID=49186 RepID=UPI003A90F975
MDMLAGNKVQATTESSTLQLVAQMHQALGFQWAHKGRRPLAGSCYNPSLMNPDYPLEHLVLGLRQAPKACVCLHGPKGTGKTEFGHYLAGALGKPLVAISAGNILEAVFGEQLLLSALNEAKLSNGILMIDDIASAQRGPDPKHGGWGAKLQPRLLQQITSYDGIVLLLSRSLSHLSCSISSCCNYFIQLGYLDFEQAWMFFNQLLGMSQLRPFQLMPVEGLEARLARVKELTPGDFVCVKKQVQASGKRLTPIALIEGLEQLGIRSHWQNIRYC